MDTPSPKRPGLHREPSPAGSPTDRRGLYYRYGRIHTGRWYVKRALRGVISNIDSALYDLYGVTLWLGPTHERRKKMLLDLARGMLELQAVFEDILKEW